MRIPSGVVDQVIFFVAVDATDYVTRETGLSSFTVYRARNTGAATAMTTPTVTELSSANMPGVYKLLLDEDMTIDAGDDSQEMVFHITHAGMAPVTRTIELYRPKVTAGETLGVSGGDVLEVNTLTGHTAQTGDAFARLGAPAGASIAADVATRASQASVDAVDDFLDTEISDIRTRVLLALPAFAPGGVNGLPVLNGSAVLEVFVAELDTGIITSATFAAGAIDAAATSADFIAEINATVDTALSDIHLDHLLAADYDPASKPGVATALLNELVESDAGVSRFTANALEQAPSGGGGGVADWTADERTAIRSILGIPASGTTPDDPTAGILDTIRDRAAAVEADTQDIQSRLPAALIAGRMDSNVQATAAALTFNLTGNVTGNLSGSVGSVTGNVGGISGVTFPANFAATVISAAGVISADVRRVNNVALQGSGVEADPWGPVS